MRRLVLPLIWARLWGSLYQHTRGRRVLATWVACSASGKDAVPRSVVVRSATQAFARRGD